MTDAAQLDKNCPLRHCKKIGLQNQTDEKQQSFQDSLLQLVKLYSVSKISHKPTFLNNSLQINDKIKFIGIKRWLLQPIADDPGHITRYMIKDRLHTAAASANEARTGLYSSSFPEIVGTGISKRINDSQTGSISKISTWSKGIE